MHVLLLFVAVIVHLQRSACIYRTFAFATLYNLHQPYRTFAFATLYIRHGSVLTL